MVEDSNENFKEKQHDFWDGGFRSNTPLREVIHAYRDYWHNKDNDEEDDVPDLEVYIADLWPSELKEEPISFDLDFVENRKLNIIFSDKTHYDEQVAEVVSDYIDLAKKLKNLAERNGASETEINHILKKHGGSKNRGGKIRKYNNLLGGRFRLAKVVPLQQLYTLMRIWHLKMIPDFSENRNKAKDNQSIPKIESYRDEVINSASFDLEWIPFNGKYQHNKTRIYAASFCTNWGERIILHISRYSNELSPERALVRDILFYLEQFPLTFGWYTTGVAVYDDKGDRVRGRDSDLFILHQRCLLYGLRSPIELRKTYAQLKDKNKKHINLIRVFEKPIIQNGVFGGIYRTTDLNTVSASLLHIGKYSDLNAGLIDITTLSIEQQEKYVMKDAELTMPLAQYNKCLALRIINIFAYYAEMDYSMTCHTNISYWYANKYDKLIKRGECTLSFTPNYKLIKQPISGGHHSSPVKGFFENTKIYELDVKGQYPTIVISNNFSFDTLNCTCCKNDEKAMVKQETIDTINEQLEKNQIPRRVSKYWVCQKRKGAFPKLLEQVLSDRERFLRLLHEEKLKANPNHFLIEDYQLIS